MLVISRKPRQSVTIGTVVVRVMRVRGKSVRLAIEAPKDVPITRDNAKKRRAA